MKNNIQNQKHNKPMNQQQGLKTGKSHSKRQWVILSLIVAAIAASVLIAAKKEVGSETSDMETFTARQDDLIITVTEGGSIRARNSVQYKCQVERRRGSQVSIVDIVPAGTYVTQEDVNNGMVLVKLDSSALEDELVEEKMELASDRENATAAKEAYDIQVIQNESDIAQAQLEVRFAMLDLEKYLGKKLARHLTADVNEASNLTDYVAPFIEQIRNDPNMLGGSAAGQELKRLEDDIVMARGNLKTAEDTLAGTERLHDANYVSDLDLERDRLNVVNRQFSLENTKVAKNLFSDYDFPKNAEQNLSNYVEAGRQLQRVYAQCRSKLAQAQARLSNAQERYKSQQSRVKELQQQIEHCTIHARAPGLVIYGTGGSEDRFRGMRGGAGAVIAEGEQVYEGQTIISMPDTASMVAEISVHETEVDKVQPAQPATIVMDAFPDKILHGKVLEVDPLPDQQRGFLNPDLKVYKTLVSIDGTHDFLRTRMSCKVEILVRELNDVVLVPIQVVANRGGKKVCYVKMSSGIEERAVQTGAFSETFVQIMEGLEPGEEILLNPPLFMDTTDGSVFQQQPRKFPGDTSGAGDANDVEGGRQPADSRGPAGMQRPEEGEGAGGRGPMHMQDGEFELTDQMIDRIMAGLRKFDPDKANELEQLRKSDPEQFKAKLRETMENMRSRMMRQGFGGQGQGRGRGAGFGDGQPPGNREQVTDEQGRPMRQRRGLNDGTGHGGQIEPTDD
jgi:HlyD family secretion protein